MIDFKTIKAGDKCRIVGMGAPGFAELGDVVTIDRVRDMRVDVTHTKTGEEAFFALTCGAQRLEKVERSFPIGGEAERRDWVVKTNRCPDCDGHLDTGYECVAFDGGCGFDALPLMQKSS